jgi:hypothetical protein
MHTGWGQPPAQAQAQAQEAKPTSSMTHEEYMAYCTQYYAAYGCYPEGYAAYYEMKQKEFAAASQPAAVAGVELPPGVTADQPSSALADAAIVASGVGQGPYDAATLAYFQQQQQQQYWASQGYYQPIPTTTAAATPYAGYSNSYAYPAGAWSQPSGTAASQLAQPQQQPRPPPPRPPSNPYPGPGTTSTAGDTSYNAAPPPQGLYRTALVSGSAAPTTGPTGSTAPRQPPVVIRAQMPRNRFGPVTNTAASKPAYVSTTTAQQRTVSAPSTAAAAPGAGKFPPSFSAWVERCFNLCRSDTDRQALSSAMLQRVKEVESTARMWTTGVCVFVMGACMGGFRCSVVRMWT